VRNKSQEKMHLHYVKLHERIVCKPTQRKTKINLMTKVGRVKTLQSELGTQINGISNKCLKNSFLN
jgi:hypothetical protein